VYLPKPSAVGNASGMAACEDVEGIIFCAHPGKNVQAEANINTKEKIFV
jgi:hypothetical protein